MSLISTLRLNRKEKSQFDIRVLEMENFKRSLFTGGTYNEPMLTDRESRFLLLSRESLSLKTRRNHSKYTLMKGDTCG